MMNMCMGVWSPFYFQTGKESKHQTSSTHVCLMVLILTSVKGTELFAYGYTALFARRACGCGQRPQIISEIKVVYEMWIDKQVWWPACRCTRNPSFNSCFLESSNNLLLMASGWDKQKLAGADLFTSPLYAQIYILTHSSHIIWTSWISNILSYSRAT